MKIIGVLLLALTFLCSCQKGPDDGASKTYNLSGYAQKGPFLIGSEVTIMELDDELDPTGKVFFSTIEDNFGYFAFPNVVFESSYIQLKVEGEYYNEVRGGVNALEEIILHTIADISDDSIINVNLITHMVQARTFELVKDGMDFSQACEQAYEELLALFYIEVNDYNKPEHLDLSSPDLNGGMLLLVSSIIQSNIGSGLNFSEFLTMLAGDFKDNGVIENEMIRKTLGTSGLVLSIEEVIENLTSRYSEFGKSIEPYQGKQFLKNFKKLNSYGNIFDVAFPETASGYENLIISGDSVIIDIESTYAIAIQGEENSDISNIQIRITSNSDNFVASGVDWYTEDNRRIFLMDYDGTDLIIPIVFNGSGELDLELFIVTHSSSMVKYPKIVVNWYE
ncbi:MAG: hypothetical protein WD577_09735 [Bacteroidales bacterium]